MNRKWIYALLLLSVTVCLLFPLYFLWGGLSAGKSLGMSMVFGVTGFLSIVTMNWKVQTDTPPSPLMRILGLAAGAMALIGSFIYDLYNEDVYFAISKALSFIILVLGVALIYRFGRLSE